MRAITAAGRAWIPCACATTSDSLTTGAPVAVSSPAPALNSSSSKSVSPQASERLRLALRIRKRSPLVMITGVMRLGRGSRHAVEIDCQQRIAGTHAITFAHVNLESLAPQRHGVDTHMEQDFGASRGTQRQCVTRRRHGDDFPVAGRAQFRAHGIDGHAITEHGFRKSRIRYFIERRAPAREWRKDDRHMYSTSSICRRWPRSDPPWRA